MGSFIFKWEHPAQEVFVTGTFDNWSKSEKLTKTGNVFQKNVTLGSAAEKIYYKFVVDGNWVTDHTASQENDASGNLNNVLTTDRIIRHSPGKAGIMSSVGPNSTTAELAKDVPLEHKEPLEHTGSAELPGAFPETPAAIEKGDFSVNPLPATNGASNPISLKPGEKVPPPSDFTANTITSGVHDDPELVAADEAKHSKVPAEKAEFSVAPIAASDGAGVQDDPELVAADKAKESEQAFGVAPIAASDGTGVHDDPELVAAGKAKNEEAAEPTFSVAPLPAFPGAINPIKLAPGEKVPAPSEFTGNSVNSAVTLDKESYENSGSFGAPVLPPVVTPQSERDANGTSLFSLPPISKNLIPESSLPMGAAGLGSFDASPFVQSAGPQSTTSILAGAVPLESSKSPQIQSVGPNSTTADLAGAVPLESSKSPQIQSVGPNSTTADLAGAVPLESSKVPEVVQESQKEAGFAPEASAIPAEVEEKSAVEKELLKEIPVAPTTSEGIAGKGTEKSEAKIPESVQQSINSINAGSGNKEVARDTPDVVKESIAQSGQSPEAAANEEAVLEKKNVEKELLSEIKPETSTGASAPAPVAAVAPTIKTVAPESSAPETSAQTAPVVTSGLNSSTTKQTTAAPVTSEEAPPATPAKNTEVPSSAPGSSQVGDSPASSSAVGDKKKKRSSFFGKLKAKFSHKD